MITQEQMQIVIKIGENIGNNKYSKLPKNESDLVREAYKTRLSVPTDRKNETPEFKNASGTLIAKGYNRIVIGDYGAYLEFLPEQVNLDVIQNKWPGKPTRPVRYIWMETKDKSRTKVYYQQGYVSYADYKPGLYYISPADLYLNGERLYNPIVGSV